MVSVITTTGKVGYLLSLLQERWGICYHYYRKGRVSVITTTGKVGYLLSLLQER